MAVSGDAVGGDVGGLIVGDFVKKSIGEENKGI